MRASLGQSLCVAGPTAAGKTGVAVQIAQALGAEIISMDSALVFRGMNIGTAKPTTAEQGGVVHHLIDTLDPTEAYSAAQFALDATRLCADINARGKVALVVGGTMLYHKALTHGLAQLPVADHAIRQAIDQEAARVGWPAMHAALAQVDPDTAKRLNPNDRQRVQRALEVWHASATPLSAWLALQERTPAINLPMLSLEPGNRAWLHARIAQRFQAMLDAGLVAEVTGLRHAGALTHDSTAMRCVGYRQVWEACDEGLSGHALHARLMQTGVAATRQLAKRQLTWLRSCPERHVLDCERLSSDELVRHALVWASEHLSKVPG